MVRGTLFQCCDCRRQTSATAGTIFQDTRKPLVTWFQAMWYVTSQTDGASALGLQHELGLGSYETAWTWLHKLRRAMVREDKDRLSGRVEVGETLVGALDKGVSGRQTRNKALVVIAAEADGPDIGRIRMRMIADASSDSLHAFVLDCIEPGSTIYTDGRRGWAGLETSGYRREIRLSGGRRETSRLMPGVHQIASLLKQWLPGTHQHAVSHRHLPYYLDEFTFRFNLRKTKSRGELFFRLIKQAVGTPPVTLGDDGNAFKIDRPTSRAVAERRG
jgi:transposase-like protein